MQHKNKCISCGAKLDFVGIATQVLFNFYTCKICKKKIAVKYKWDIMLGAFIGGVIGALVGARHPGLSLFSIAMVSFIATFFVLGFISYYFSTGEYRIKDKEK